MDFADLALCARRWTRSVQYRRESPAAVIRRVSWKYGKIGLAIDGRLAQRLERPAYTGKVRGSNP